MKVLFDTNVLLDVLLDREPFATASAGVLSRAEKDEISGYACATTITTLFYLCRKEMGKDDARQNLQTLLSLLGVAPVNQKVVERALQADFNDFEDAILSESAVFVSAAVIVTRNKKDFSNSSVVAYTPEEFLNLLDSDALSA